MSCDIILGHHIGLHGQVFLSHLLIVLWTSFKSTRAQSDHRTCKPQGLLTLDAPYPQLQVLEGGLPFCPQFPCTCCNRSHITAMHRSMAGAFDEPSSLSSSFSSRCAEMLKIIACRPCDPMVGVGLKEKVCRHTCKAWLSACRNDYFGFDSISGALVPCSNAAATSRLLICSRLNALVPEGAEQLCALEGLEVVDAEAGATLCYDGSTMSSDLGQICEGAPVVKRRVRTGRSGGASSSESMFSWSALWVKLTLAGVLLYFINMVRGWMKKRSKPKWRSNLHTGHSSHGLSPLKGPSWSWWNMLSGGQSVVQTSASQKLAGKPYRPHAHPR
ncbi:hypothetical protein CEUSTIGMA_g8403.t1 [Chlamydomonas eustigma]|uniref:Folate receptor-like domain-containing protein n=1 Tax=Chlamydomonas eustigma TaxID=1157962 RepID=A0A250XD00_9CHLO|nr:hypothetical protein CEUSTIGMA_g8403.t1 [Chlamydomonas eustigma]|eukprot:GAX80968.1 hypothetical protein CEUSTIGMA_g8403.t1 [Chlamydomonas eustigma]